MAIKGNSKWARLRQVAAEEPKEADAAIAEVAEALGTMAEALSALRENLDLIEAPKTASIRVRIAASKKYASTFRRYAEEAPEAVAGAISEVYHSLDDVAGALENLAENMGIELSLTPAEAAFGEEGKEELEGEWGPEEPESGAEPVVDEEKAEAAEEELDEEIEKEAGALEFVSDRGEGEPKAPVLAAKKKDLKPGEYMDGDKKKTRCKSCGAFLVKGKCPVSAKDCGRSKKADGGAGSLLYACQIKDEDGQVEEATNARSVAECVTWFKERGVDFSKVDTATKGNVTYFVITYYPSSSEVKGFANRSGSKKKADGSAAFINDRDENAKPESPKKLEIPQAQGETEVGKAAAKRAELRARIAKRWGVEL